MVALIKVVNSKIVITVLIVVMEIFALVIIILMIDSV